MPLLFDRSRLSADHAGVWFAFQGFLGAVNLADFGLSQVLSRQVAYSFKRRHGAAAVSGDFIETSHGWTGVAELLHAARRMFLWLNVAGVLFIIVSYELVVPLGKLLSQRGPDITFAWYLLGLATLVSLQSKLYQGVLDGLGRTYAGRIILGTIQLLNGAAVVGVMLWRPAIFILAAVSLFGAALQLTALQIWLRLLARGQLARPMAKNPVSLRALWKVAIPFGVVNASAFLVSSIQVPLIGSLLGSAAVAPFYLAQKIGQTASMIVQQAVYPHLPLFTHALAAGHPVEAHHRMTRLILLVAALAFSGFLAYFALSPWLVTVWIGSGHYVDTATLAWLSLDYCCMCVSVTVAHFVLASGRNPFLFSTALSGLVTLSACLVLTPGWGATGVAVSGLAAGVLTNYWFAPYSGWKLWRSLKETPR